MATKKKAQPFTGGWPKSAGGDTFQLSDGSKVEGLEEATTAQAKIGWPRPFHGGGYITSDRRRYSQEATAKAAQQRIDKESA